MASSLNIVIYFIYFTVTVIFSLSRQETEPTVSVLRGVDKQHKVSQLVFSVLKTHNSDAFPSVFYTKSKRFKADWPVCHE